jgi:hypothetical protein
VGIGPRSRLVGAIRHSGPWTRLARERGGTVGGGHAIPDGVPLPRDRHRLFDLGRVPIRPDLSIAVSSRPRDDA